ncbi:unnamed protein product, partial [Brassica oleracea]
MSLESPFQLGTRGGSSYQSSRKRRHGRDGGGRILTRTAKAATQSHSGEPSGRDLTQIYSVRNPRSTSLTTPPAQIRLTTTSPSLQ